MSRYVCGWHFVQIVVEGSWYMPFPVDSSMVFALVASIRADRECLILVRRFSKPKPNPMYETCKYTNHSCCTFRKWIFLMLKSLNFNVFRNMKAHLTYEVFQLSRLNIQSASNSPSCGVKNGRQKFQISLSGKSWNSGCWREEIYWIITKGAIPGLEQTRAILFKVCRSSFVQKSSVESVVGYVILLLSPCFVAVLAMGRVRNYYIYDQQLDRNCSRWIYMCFVCHTLPFQL